ncbi:hypothetical protein [Dictyobacter vulcani]|uniref:hypothetical protein n=1 Tax=Dictyobacter vulcani TaxID=2607529 RepID=UPI00124FCE2D|nr:hypothetical protein [Dictyobacter vulcani]
MAWRRVRREGATRGGRPAAFAQASVQERRAVLWRLHGSCVPWPACSRSNVVGERVDPPRTFSKRITTQDPSRGRRHRHAMLVEPLAPRERRMPASRVAPSPRTIRCFFLQQLLQPQKCLNETYWVLCLRTVHVRAGTRPAVTLGDVLAEPQRSDQDALTLNVLVLFPAFPLKDGGL